MTDVESLLHAVNRNQTALHLDTTDLCFLIALHLRAERSSLASFEEELLYDVYEQVCVIVEPDAQQRRKRATYAIQRLRQQRLLARVDGAGLVRSGEYAMTRLAWAIVEQHIEDEALTRESLTLLTHTLTTQLEDIRRAAQGARHEEDWKVRVINPLRITVSDLISGIERRQRGLDTQQELIRLEIAALLQRDWFDAIEACEGLLQQTARTLQELNEVLLRDTSRLQALLHDISQRAFERRAREAEETVGRVADHIDRVVAWGSARLRAWSDYFQFVQRYLRAVVRLDPNRALSQRLRDQIARWRDRPFALVAAAQPPLRVMRQVNTRLARPPVTRPPQALEMVLEELQPSPLAHLPLEDRVHVVLRERPRSLAYVVRALIEDVPEAERYKAIGRITAVVARASEVHDPIQRPWTPVAAHIEVEDWDVRWERSKP